MPTIAIQNRNESYFKIIDNLPQKRQLIYQIIKEIQPCTLSEIQEKYLIPPNEISGRITELKNAFLISETGSKKNRWTGHKNTIYSAVVDLNTRIDLINLEYSKLIESKDKLLNDYHQNISDLSKEMIERSINKIQSKIKGLENILNQFNN